MCTCSGSHVLHESPEKKEFRKEAILRKSTIEKQGVSALPPPPLKSEKLVKKEKASEKGLEEQQKVKALPRKVKGLEAPKKIKALEKKVIKAAPATPMLAGKIVETEEKKPNSEWSVTEAIRKAKAEDAKMALVVEHSKAIVKKSFEGLTEEKEFHGKD